MFLILSRRVQLPYLESMVCFIYHDGYANQSTKIALSSESVFNYRRYTIESIMYISYIFQIWYAAVDYEELVEGLEPIMNTVNILSMNTKVVASLLLPLCHWSSWPASIHLLRMLQAQQLPCDSTQELF